ncbi:MULTISPECIES: arginine--tRNA ligase [unclassified Paraflavitalea]|uniref:arginine--tRNA ligase n=1 Tax=unclassified Paraflavitalea TaxID=2798305 RepID=UPI003D334DCD
MGIVASIQSAVSKVLHDQFQVSIPEAQIAVNETKPEFEGDYTVVLFNFVKQLKKAPEQLGQELGDALTKATPDLFESYNVIKGFLNLSIADSYWTSLVEKEAANKLFGTAPASGKKVMVEYSSPNTNKPLHLGHLRNNFLGWSIAQIYKMNGYEVAKTCISNDRGIHICKSMIAWERFGNGATPESTGIKGDHLVGDYYVMFGEELKKEVAALVEKGMSKEEAEKSAPIQLAAQQMLVDWEAGKPEVIELWKKMNSWVYSGFKVTYKRIGSDFDKQYYESDTYLLGKDMVQQGLEKGVFFQKEDGSVWIDLTADGLDQKIVQRKDGTAVYITQDIGLADLKQKEFGSDISIYVVGDEQNYHFKVLKLICEKLGLKGAEGIYHLSYGMVELPTGRMKTREGTVVDADDIVDEMESIAAKLTEELGKVNDFTEEERKELYHTLGMGALKFFLLRVDPKKRMIFNPEESIDFHGFTGPFIQFSHARAKSILRKEQPSFSKITVASLHKQEKQLIIELEKYPSILADACKEMNPSVISNYVFKLAQSFNSFVTECRVLTAETPEQKELRLQLCSFSVHVISTAMNALGIAVPDRM